MRALFINEIPSSFDAQLFTEVLTCYQNKFAAVRRNLGFEAVTYKGIDLYKRNTKKHAKGDFKKVVNDRRDTPLSICLTYLARYGNNSTLEYITKAMETCDDKQREHYGNILRCCEKFGFERLWRRSQHAGLKSRVRRAVEAGRNYMVLPFSTIRFITQECYLLVAFDERFVSLIYSSSIC